jgi:hypothetical protein
VADITFYRSFDEMMKDLSRAMKQADARVKPAQANIKPGQYFINFRHGPELPIFGQVLDIKTLGINDEEQKYINETYSQPHMRYYRPSKCYSAACEWGEAGDTHLSSIDAIIEGELFDFYKSNKWRKPYKK